MSDFATAIERALGHEGAYVNDPEDPGGETNWGISKRSYPQLNIAELTRKQAIDIYERDFWHPVAARLSSFALRFQVLDAAINHGMGNATRMLQRAVGVTDDGHWGPISKRAAARLSEAELGALFMAERLEFWARLKHFDRYGRGWTRRAAGNLRWLAKDTQEAGQ